MIRHSSDVADLHGKQPVTDSLFAGSRKQKVWMPCHWRNPDEGWINVNVDGAFNNKMSEGGLGVVIRDAAGKALLTSWCFVRNAGNA
jgi:hypothetical protein